jgi:Tol biopolymer transport system component
VDANGLHSFQYTVERLAYPSGQPEVLAQNAYWPRLSADGSKLVFVTFGPVNYSSQLFVANADGTEPKQIVLPDTLLVDAPLFSPDGQWIIFSGADLGRVAPLSWLDRLLGVRVASAHNVLSDWWRIPIAGGKPEQLTELSDYSLYGDFSPDGQYFVFACVTGLFVMPAPVGPVPPDRSALTLILYGAGVYSTVNWIP